MKKGSRLVGLSLLVTCVSVIALDGCHNASTQSTAVGAAPAAPKSGASGDDRATRIAVKHATDPGAASISLDAKDTTISDMVGQAAPDADLSGKDYASKRVGPFETTVWRVKAHVDSIQHRKDGDYYLVISDSSGKQTVVEVPDPALCKGSPMASEIEATRKDLETRFHPTDASTKIDADATITGVGFFGFRSKPGRRGPANGARLMPGLGFKWNPK
jgi:hypothetical protein